MYQDQTMSVLKKMSKNSTNDRVYSLVWCPDDDEDVNSPATSTIWTLVKIWSKSDT